jgi:hypothetical protein
MLAWFEKISLNNLQPEDIRSFFEKHKGGKGNPSNKSEYATQAAQEAVYVTTKVAGENSMDVDGEEGELKIYT